MPALNRRTFIRDLGLSAAAAPFLAGLPALAATPPPAARKRIVFLFSPNGTIPSAFWPDEEGEDFQLKEILAPLEPFKKRLLTLHGVCNKIRGDGDGHMRGMSCLLTGKELFPGNIQGGSDTPAGWASGISIDQEIKDFLQAREETRTRFGSLEFGVGVADRADPWTRMSYAGPNQPVAPVDSPYQMFEKLYGEVRDRGTIVSVLDRVRDDLARVGQHVGPEDRRLLEEHATFVAEMERDLRQARGKESYALEPPQLEAGVKDENDNLPKICRMQTDLLVNSFANDLARVATLQFTKSVGQARMRWLGIDKGHHSLSHDPDSKEESVRDLIKINTWFCQQLRYLLEKLDATPDPAGNGSLLDSTTVVWTNELGKGNSHTLNNIPFVAVGGGLGWRTGRSLKFDRVPHNRLLMAFAHGMGHGIDTFGNPRYCQGGALDLS